MTRFNKSYKETLKRYGGYALPYAVLIGKDGVIKQKFNGMFRAYALVKAIGLFTTPI